MQDIFSRFLFAIALRSKAEVESAFLRLMRDTKRKPSELNTDSGSEFANRSFQAMLEREASYGGGYTFGEFLWSLYNASTAPQSAT